MKILSINCGSSLTYFKEKGLDLDVSYKVNNYIAPLKYLYEVPNQAGQMVKLYTPDITAYLEKTYKTEDYDFIIWGYDPSKYGSELASTGGYTSTNQLKGGAFWCTVRMDVNSEKYLTHEMHHLICNYINIVLKDIRPKDFMDSTPVGNPPVWKPYYKNDTPQAPDSNHSATWNNIIPFLPKLNAVRKPVVGKYKYFSEAEILKWKLKPELWAILDKARDIAGVPFKLTSGLRSPSQNALVGGVNGSEHTLGTGCDILADTSEKRFKILSGAIQAGFTRIGVYNNHLHLGCGQLPTFPQNVVWVIDKD